MKKNAMLLLSLLIVAACSDRGINVYDLADYGIIPDTGEDLSAKFCDALQKIKLEAADADSVLIKLAAGRYDFHPDEAVEREYYISNHDQPNPRRVGILMEGWRNMTLDGNGADLVFHGRMLPVSMVDCEGCTVSNLSIDFDKPHIAQIEVVENRPEEGVIVYKPAPWVDWKIEDGKFMNCGEGWELQPRSGIAFDGNTGHLLYRTSDIAVGTSGVEAGPDGTVTAPWKDSRFTPGTVIALRSYYRPAPGIFLYHDVRTVLENVTVHYAEGMGLLAQMCEDIDLEGFNVSIRPGSGRYFTTQADATHFSGCKGRIVSCGGLYEGMMDDAINVHGTYLKVVGREGSNTLIARYMHGQSYGFHWGSEGDEVQFISSRTMELVGEKNKISSICAADRPTEHGAKEFRIEFAAEVPAEISEEGDFGVENLSWTPEVYFSGNTVRNNRARGALFSTPRRVECTDNFFDHTSGAAILLCGDCNGWFETGACHDVLISGNHFLNALTNMFQFTNAVISIYPEIPDLEHQQKYFHSGIVIEDNVFETFDYPLLYAKSVDGLVFRNNKVSYNRDFPPFHRMNRPVTLERVVNVVF